jgi:hypothetical protein
MQHIGLGPKRPAIVQSVWQCWCKEAHAARLGLQAEQLSLPQCMSVSVALCTASTRCKYPLSAPCMDHICQVNLADGVTHKVEQPMQQCRSAHASPHPLPAGLVLCAMLLQYSFLYHEYRTGGPPSLPQSGLLLSLHDCRRCLCALYCAFLLLQYSFLWHDYCAPLDGVPALLLSPPRLQPLPVRPMLTLPVRT